MGTARSNQTGPLTGTCWYPQVGSAKIRLYCCCTMPCLQPAHPAALSQVMALLQKRIISRCNQLGKPVLITRIVDTVGPLSPQGMLHPVRVFY